MNALVLCAGFGRRLGELCRDTPKPLLSVGERAIVEHILESLSACGFTDVWINLHHHAEQFRARLGTGAGFGLRIHYRYETQPLGTAGTVASLAEVVGPHPLLVHYGDILTDHDLGALMRVHRSRSNSITILVHQRPGTNSVALFGDDDRIHTFIERPESCISDNARDSWAFSGIAVVSPTVVSRIHRADGVMDLPAHVFPLLAEQGLLYGQRLRGYRCAIDSPQRLDSAREALQSSKFMPVTRRTL